MNPANTIPGKIAMLRPPGEGDLDLLVELRNDVALQALLLAVARGSSPDQVRQWIHKRTGDPQGCLFMIAETGSGRGVGYLQLTGIDETHGFAELGFCIDPREHRKGFGRDAHLLLERHARSALGLRKFILRVLSTNAPALAFYESLNYRTAGRYERHVLIDGAYRDVILMEKFLHPDA